MINEEPPDEDVFKILVATDNHLGYGEKKAEIADDSFRTFEEILKLAVEHSVDFILLGGDLFHNACPSAFATYKCLDLLRKYCLGDKPVEFEFLSDQSFHFSHLSNPSVNYEDPNLNVSMPVFSIHGNHDDPVGQKQLSALDILASAGLLNYFGHWNDLTKVDVAPMLLKKGETQLAIYGMSHIKDERMGRLFLDKKVTFFKAEGDWFNLLVLHQNRYEGRGRKNFVPDSVLPEFLNLIIWGHEHECIIEPQKCKSDSNIYISQPGSSVATSLSKGECPQKHVGLLHVYKTQFKMTPIPLKTVRPFVHSEILLEIREEDNQNEYVNKTPKEYAIQQVNEAMEKLIIEAKKKATDESKNMLPFVRLVVYYADDCQNFNAIRLGLTFKDRIVNPEDAILLKRATSRNFKNKNKYEVFESEDLKKPSDWAEAVEDVVRKYFENEENGKKIKVCYAEHLLEAVRRFTDKEESESSSTFDPFDVVIDHERKETAKKVKEIAPEPRDLNNCLENLRAVRQAAEKEITTTNVGKLLDNVKLTYPTRSKSSVGSDSDEALMISDDDDGASRTINFNNKPARGRGSRGGRRGTETGRAKRRGRARGAAAFL